MAQMGEIIIAATVAITLVATLLSIFSEDMRHIAAAKSLFAAAALTGGAAAAVLVFLLVTHDYRVVYVRMYADRTMATGYLITALWGGHQGSLLFWAMLQSWFAAAVAYWYIEKDVHVFRIALGILGAIAIFFWLIVLTQSNPFTVSGEDPFTSFGMNPLLRNFYMVFHPPTLFIGFAAVSVPFAVGMAVMIRERCDNDWLPALRPWILFGFVFLSIGNILGMVWAYEELGWGGYWGWDPVENASLMPWFTATALVHATMAQRRWGIMKRWNLSLLMVTFLLTIFGTFLTRSGIIQSVHAFADATEGPYLLGLMAVVLLAFGYLMARRFKSLAPDNRYEEWSRQWLFEATNWLFTISLLFVGIATMWPFFLDVFKGEEATMKPEFFNKWMVPIGLLLFATIGVCGVTPKANAKKNAIQKRQLQILLAVLTVSGIAAGALVGPQYQLGRTLAFMPALSVGLIVFVAGVLLTQIRQSFLSKNNVRLGGQLVHLAMVLMYVGFTGAGFVSEKKASLGTGEFMYIDNIKVTFLGLRGDINFEREAIFADLEVNHPDGHVEVLSPARFLYHSHSKQPTSEVSIRTTAGKDLFFILGETEIRNNRAVIKVLLNPLVVWIWIGGILLVIGCLMAMSGGGFRRFVEMNASLRQRLTLPAAGLLATAVFAVIGDFWQGIAGTVAMVGALGIVAAFALLARAVIMWGAAGPKSEKRGNHGASAH